MQQLINAILGDSDASANMQQQLTPTLNWPSWLVLLIFIVAAAAVVVSYVREWKNLPTITRTLLVSLRLALIGLLVLMLYGWTRQLHRTDLPDVVVVLDVSESMQATDKYLNPKLASQVEAYLAAANLPDVQRINLGKSLLLAADENSEQNWLQHLTEQYRLRVYSVGQSLRLLAGGPELPEAVRDLEPTESATLLGDNLRQVIQHQRGRPTAAVIVITDGITTQGKTAADVAEYARRKSIPFFIVGVGSEQRPMDLRLTDVVGERVAFVGDMTHFEAKIAGSGIQDKPIEIRLRRKQDDQVLDTATVRLTEDSPTATARLQYRPEAEGTDDLVVEMDVIDGEIDSQNNAVERQIRIHDETLRVLLVNEYPSYEFRYLKDVLSRGLKRSEDKSQRSIALTTVLQQADDAYIETDENARRVFPLTQDELNLFDVVIFGDVNPAYLARSAVELLANFVTQRGGGLVFCCGPRHSPLAYRGTPLEPLLPVKLQNLVMPASDGLLLDEIRPSVTPLGSRSPQLQLTDDPAQNEEVWQGLPPLYWLVEASDLREGGRVLLQSTARTGLNGKPLPIVCAQFVGAGQVIFHATDETYRWSRYHGTDEMFVRYWVQTIRYLCRAKLAGSEAGIQLTASGTYRRTDSVPIRIQFDDLKLAPARDDGVTVVVQQEGGKRHNVKLRRLANRRGVFEGSVSGLEDGQYRVWLAAPTVEGSPPSQVFQIKTENSEKVRLQLDSENLKLAAKTSGGKYYSFQTASDLLDDLPEGRHVRIESLPPTPVWNVWIFPSLFVIIIVSEWLLRKKSGLL